MVWCGGVWCGVAWCGVVWWCVVWCGVVWWCVVWCGVVRWGEVWCGVVVCGVVWCGGVWCGVVRCGGVWCGVVRCGTGHYELRGNTVVQTKATLKVVRTREKRLLTYTKIENAILCSLSWTHVANFISKGTIYCSYVPETA